MRSLENPKTGSKVKDQKIERYRGNDAVAADGPSWAAIPAETLVSFVALATAAGDACSFSYAAEGMELMLTVFSGGARDRMFFKDPQEATGSLNAMCANLVDYLRKAGSVAERERAGRHLD